MDPIEIAHVNHFFGSGALRRQILFDVSTTIRAGEIVIVTGPSGSGKTTLLTLIGALRTVQEGSVRILGEELRGATARVVAGVRRRIGYIFQAHNLLSALTAVQNVQMAMALDRSASRPEMRRRAVAILEAVGLGKRLEAMPDEMSGGQKQRVAIARALAAGPRVILADEPTASLDKQSGRDVVTLMHDLAKRDGVTVLLVTHDNRILDVADRIIHLEDGRLSSFATAVARESRRLMDTLAQHNRKGDLAQHVRGLSMDEFGQVLADATAECEEFLRVTELGNTEAFDSMLEQTLEAITLKIGDILAADRVSLFLVDEAQRELFSKVAQGADGRPLEIRVPFGAGIVGRVVETGEAMNVPDAYAEPLFNRRVDAATGYRTRSILCVPLRNRQGRVFAVVQVLNRRDGDPFDGRDEQRLREFSTPLGLVLESWGRMARREQPRQAEPPP